MRRSHLVGAGTVLLWTSLSASALADEAPATGAAPTTAPATSAPAASGEWGGLFNGRTLGSGGGAVVAEAGWPGITGGVLFGVIDKVDVGAKVGGLWAGPTIYETHNFTSYFGLDLRGVARFGIVQGDTVSVLARVEPGFRFAALDPQVMWGIEVVLGADVGIKVDDNGSVYAGLEIPLTFITNPISATMIPILPGVGYEYHLNDFIGVGGRFNAGPSIDVANSPITGTTQTQVDFAFIGQGFFVLRWDRMK
jgi:hypothetical protein